MAGKVYLVGAGPGDPELLTVKGKRALAEADIVIYDRLANPKLLAFAREEAERIYAGKASDRHALSQEELNTLLVTRAASGSVVCRLKGGDPFLFGRGGEEALALVAAGIAWEYVPGVSSAFAVPGYAGIPVTHRSLSSSVAVITGHEDPARAEPDRDWAALVAGVETLVFLMGAERLPGLVARLLEAGRSSETPSAVIRWGTMSSQITIAAPLGDLVARCMEAVGAPAGDPAACPGALRALSPATLVVGQVAGLRPQLQWWDRGPLFGRRIAVTRAAEQAGGLARWIEAGGGEAILCPTIRIRALPDLDLTQLATPYDWIVFTSANSVRSLVGALRSAGGDVRRLGTARIAAIGPGTAAALDGAGLHVDFVPSVSVAEAVVEEFPGSVSGRRILLPRAREAREVLPERWRAAGAAVDVLPVYETIPDPEGASRLRECLASDTVDVITFTAASTVRSLVRSLGTSSFGRAQVVCIGPITAAAATELGVRVDVVAETHTVPGLQAALEQLFGPASRAGMP